MTNDKIIRIRDINMKPYYSIIEGYWDLITTVVFLLNNKMIVFKSKKNYTIHL